MKNIISELKQNDFVLPDYNNSNLSAIKDIVSGKAKRFGNKKKTIFMVVDGLGYNLIERMIEAKDESAKFLEGARVEKVTTIFPSTTAPTLTSLETGLTPSEHGIVGWRNYSNEMGIIVMPYRDSPALSKDFKLSKAGFDSILPNPTLLLKASKKSRMLFIYHENVNNETGRRIENADHEYYAEVTDMMIKIRNAVKRNENNLVYAYYPGIDHLEHIYGPSSEEVKNAVQSFFAELKKVVVPTLEKSDYRLVITADHGQIEAGKSIIIDSDSKILQYLAGPPWGDARIFYLNVFPGKEAELRRHFDKTYGKDAFLFDSNSLIKTGIFWKNIRERIRYRFGTHIIIAKKNNALFYEYPREGAKSHAKLGVHSGLSKAEMEVPIIVY